VIIRHIFLYFLASSREFARNRGAAFFTFAMPVVFVVIFGMRSTGAVAPMHPRLDIECADTSERASQLVAALIADVNIAARRTEAGMGQQDLDAGNADAVIYIPEGAMSAGYGGTPVRLVADGFTAPSFGLALERARRHLDDNTACTAADFSYRVEKPPAKMNYFTFAFPGLIAMALLQVGIVATALDLLRSRQSGALRFVFLSPVNHGSVLVGQIAFRFCIVAVQVACLLLIGLKIYDLHPVGSLVPVVGVALLGAGMLISCGYALAGALPASETGTSLISLLQFVMLFGGGIFFNPKGSTWFFAELALPTVYVADALRQLLVGAPAMLPLEVDVLAMLAITVLATFLAAKTFRFHSIE
jgi:ABC-2 type transport system permease protein